MTEQEEVNLKENNALFKLPKDPRSLVSGICR